MNIAKKFLVWLSSIFLHLMLFSITASVVSLALLGDASTVKTIISSSGIYDDFVTSTIEFNQQNSAPTTLPLNDESVQAVIVDSFSPDSLRAETEKAIDSIYDWLQGDENDLRFAMDFNESKDAMIAGLSTYAINRVAEKPECTADQLRNSTVFDLMCRPPGDYQNEVRSAVSRDINSSDFFDDMTVTESILPKGTNEKTFSETYWFVPKIYRNLELWRNLSFVFFGVAAVAYVVVRASVREGVKALGRDFLSNGAILIGFTIVFGFILPKYTNQYSVSSGGPTDSLNRVFDQFMNQVDFEILTILVWLVAAGIVILVLERISRPANAYAKVRKKSGLSTSVPPKKSTMKKPTSKSKSIPLQTSEAERVVRAKKPKSKKYTNIGIS